MMNAHFQLLLLVSAVAVTGLSGCYRYDCPQTADARTYQDPAQQSAVAVSVQPRGTTRARKCAGLRS